MTATDEDAEQATDDRAKWQMADYTHLVGLDIDQIVASGTSAEARSFGDMFGAALEDDLTQDANRPALEMLRAIMWMSASTEPSNSAFAPVFQGADGSRSAAPDDFRGSLVGVIVACLEMTSHPVVRARLAHLAWFLERNRKAIGLEALDAYIEILKMLDVGGLTADGEATALSIAGNDLVTIALNVSRGLGYPDEQEKALRDTTDMLFRRACKLGVDWAVRLFGELGHRLINPQPDTCCCELDEGEEVCVVLFVSRGYGPVMLEL